MIRNRTLAPSIGIGSNSSWPYTIQQLRHKSCTCSHTWQAFSDHCPLDNQLYVVTSKSILKINTRPFHHANTHKYTQIHTNTHKYIQIYKYIQIHTNTYKHMTTQYTCRDRQVEQGSLWFTISHNDNMVTQDIGFFH